MSRVRPLLVVAFLAVPLVEITLIVETGRVIGVAPTILLLLAVSIAGAWLLKREGLRAWRKLHEAVSTGRLPDRELADGALVLVGGTLLLTPGFLTDAVGLLLVLPFTRPLARRLLTGVIARRVLRGQPAGPGARGAPPGWPGQAHGPSRASGPDRVVPGEVVDPQRDGREPGPGEQGPGGPAPG